MTERWQREIKTLREFEPDPDLGSRVAEGPRLAIPPPVRHRVIAGVTALAAFSAAAILVVSVFGTRSGEPGRAPAPGTLVIELSSGGGQSGAPSATLRYRDLVQEGARQEYTWCDGDECVSGISEFAFHPPGGEYLVVPPGSPIEVTGDGVVRHLRLDTGTSLEPVDTAAEPMRIPNTDATYTLEVEATWDDGAATFLFGIQSLSSPSAAPDSIRVDRSSPVAHADTAVVRTQADGLHVEFVGTEGLSEFGIVTPEGTPWQSFFGVGGPLPEDGQRGLSVDPGRWEVGCGTRDDPVRAGELTAAFELVDPNDHWASFRLACTEPDEVSFSSSIPSSVGHQDAASRILAGLGGEDRLRGAGYGAEQFVRVGPMYIVERDRESVARLQLHAIGGSAPPEGPTWTGTFVAFPESGIELAPALASPSPPRDGAEG
jgi:hypothetical protein